MLSQPTHKSHPPVMPGYYPGKPPVKIPKKVDPQVERPSTFRVQPATPAYWDAYARMTLEVLEEARISKFVLEECAEETTRFSVEEQIAAMAVQEARHLPNEGVCTNHEGPCGQYDRENH